VLSGNTVVKDKDNKMAIKKHLAVSSLLGASFAALGQTSFIVEDLKVEGLQRVALGAALTHIPINVGDNVDDYTISKTIKSLYRSGLSNLTSRLINKIFAKANH